MKTLKRPRSTDRVGVRREARSRRHRRALELMTGMNIPFLVGGGHALRHHTGGVRGTKDLDVFVRRPDAPALLNGMSTAGFKTDLTFPHWLGHGPVQGGYIDRDDRPGG